MVLCKQNDRFPKKCLFSLSKTSFLMPEGLLKAPLGDPSEDQMTERAQSQKRGFRESKSIDLLKELCVFQERSSLLIHLQKGPKPIKTLKRPSLDLPRPPTSPQDQPKRGPRTSQHAPPTSWTTRRWVLGIDPLETVPRPPQHAPTTPPRAAPDQPTNFNLGWRDSRSDYILFIKIQ